MTYIFKVSCAKCLLVWVQDSLAMKASEMQACLEDVSTTADGNKSKDGSPESSPGTSATSLLNTTYLAYL